MATLWRERRGQNQRRWVGVAALFLLVRLLCSLPSSLSSPSVVTHLPGFDGPLPFYLETGYVNVEEKGVELFYYFLRSERNHSEDPFLVWLSGGPGCSSFSGLAFEVGPLQFVAKEYDGSLPSLTYRPFTWTKLANIIFVDSPVGTGFSFSKSGSQYDDEVGDISTSHGLHNFILKGHPEYISNPLYIAGNSYAGKVIPAVAEFVAEGIEAGKEPSVNLKGYFAGNPFTGEIVDFNSRVPHAHGLGVISDELARMIEKQCVGENIRSPHTLQCAHYIGIFNKFLAEIDTNSILEPKCLLDSPRPSFVSESARLRSLQEHPQLIRPPQFPELKCRNYVYVLSYYWANDNVTRKALGVKEGTVREWLRCYRDNPYKLDIQSNLKYHLNLSRKGYRALVISGDHDLVIPFPGTYQWIKSLNLTLMDEWRSWSVGGQVAGYTKTYSNLTFATVKGAGHVASQDKPEENFVMFQRWLSYQPL